MKKNCLMLTIQQSLAMAPGTPWSLMRLLREKAHEGLVVGETGPVKPNPYLADNRQY